jgi:hypothetical protein
MGTLGPRESRTPCRSREAWGPVVLGGVGGPFFIVKLHATLTPNWSARRASGQGQAADLTICRACSSSNVVGLRYPSAECDCPQAALSRSMTIFVCAGGWVAVMCSECPAHAAVVEATSAAHHSGLATEDLTIGAQRAFSCSMNLANVAASIPSASMPSCSSLTRISGKSKALSTS